MLMAISVMLATAQLCSAARPLSTAGALSVDRILVEAGSLPDSASSGSLPDAATVANITGQPLPTIPPMDAGEVLNNGATFIAKTVLGEDAIRLSVVPRLNFSLAVNGGAAINVGGITDWLRSLKVGDNILSLDFPTLAPSKLSVVVVVSVMQQVR